MRLLRFSTLGLVALMGLTAAPVAHAQGTTATAQPVVPLTEALTGQAGSDYSSARILFGDGDYQGALQKLGSAYQLSKDPRLLWNMAACEKNLRHYGQSLTYVEQYLRDGGNLVSADDRATADAFVATLRDFVTELEVTVNQPGATIFVDDQPMGTSPLPAPLKVDMGKRTLRVHKDGFTDFVWSTELQGGRSVGITAQLAEARHEGKLRVVAGARDAIQVDGKVVGTGLWEGVLPSGPHSVHVTDTGKLPYHTDVVVKDNDSSTVHVTLQAERSSVAMGGGGGSYRPYESSGVPAWVWIAGGVVVVGAGAGAYFLTRPNEDKGFQSPRDGSWGAIEL